MLAFSKHIIANGPIYASTLPSGEHFPAIPAPRPRLPFEKLLPIAESEGIVSV